MGFSSSWRSTCCDGQAWTSTRRLPSAGAERSDVAGEPSMARGVAASCGWGADGAGARSSRGVLLCCPWGVVPLGSKTEVHGRTALAERVAQRVEPLRHEGTAGVVGHAEVHADLAGLGVQVRGDLAQRHRLQLDPHAAVCGDLGERAGRKCLRGRRFRCGTGIGLRRRGGGARRGSVSDRGVGRRRATGCRAVDRGVAVCGQCLVAALLGRSLVGRLAVRGGRHGDGRLGPGLGGCRQANDGSRVVRTGRRRHRRRAGGDLRRGRGVGLGRLGSGGRGGSRYGLAGDGDLHRRLAVARRCRRDGLRARRWGGRRGRLRTCGGDRRGCVGARLLPVRRHVGGRISCDQGGDRRS